jgi:hypothetical protein
MGRLDDGDTFRGQSIMFRVAALVPDVDPHRTDVSIEVRCGDQPMTIQSSSGRVTVQAGHAAAPDLVLTGPPCQPRGDAMIEATLPRLRRHIHRPTFGSTGGGIAV